jgi:hypothetical protein
LLAQNGFRRHACAVDQLDADFRLEIADLPAQRRLRGMQLLLGGDRQAAPASATATK